MDDKVENAKIISFIFECCTKLNLNSITLATACVAFHKFYEKCDGRDYDPYTIASSCIFLATKVEEEHTRLRDIINVCHRVLHPDSYLELNEEYWEYKDTLAKIELQILRMLEFKVIFDHPHKYMLHYLLSISQLFNKEEWNSHAISNVAWAILRDSYHGNVCLLYKPEIIALGCIGLSFGLCRLKSKFKHDVPWYKALHKECTREMLGEVQAAVARCYDHENTS